MEVFNKSFFRFLSGFLSLILLGLGMVFAVGLYEVEILGKGKEIATPVNNKSSVGLIFKEISKSEKDYPR